MLFALLCHLTLLTIAVLRRKSEQGIIAFLLLFNWIACSTFCWFAHVEFPVTWFITIDWLTAIVLWIDRDSTVGRVLIGTYAVELIAHAAFAYLTRNADSSNWTRTDAGLYWTQVHYRDILSAIEWAQMAIVGGWIAYDAVCHYLSAGWRFSSAIARFWKPSC